jgi:FMN-dependent NADH-azoreductase
MTRLLRIDSSSRTDGSHSSQLADQAEAMWREANPQGQIVRRHLGRDPIPVLSQETIMGFFSPQDMLTDDLREATALSDQLIGELQTADTLLLAVPIYNFSVPAALKCWIDQITRISHTFAYEDGAFRGLTKTRRAVVICAYGADGYLEGQSFEAANFLEPYLRFLLSFLGIEDIEVVSVQATTADEATVAAHLAQSTTDLSTAMAASRLETA